MTDMTGKPHYLVAYYPSYLIAMRLTTSGEEFDEGYWYYLNGEWSQDTTYLDLTSGAPIDSERLPELTKDERLAARASLEKTFAALPDTEFVAP